MAAERLSGGMESASSQATIVLGTNEQPKMAALKFNLGDIVMELRCQEISVGGMMADAHGKLEFPLSLSAKTPRALTASFLFVYRTRRVGP